MKLAVYTAVYGAYERMIWPARFSCPAYFYTDSPGMAKAAEAKGWIPKLVQHSIVTLNGKTSITEPMLNHKYWKTHPRQACPGADVSLWLDGSMEVTRDDYVERCVEFLGEDDWAMVTHPERDCWAKEAEYSAPLHWRYDEAVITRQLKHYRQIGFGEKTGLMATGRNVRRHTPQVLALCRHWWIENLIWSHQDQISLPVLLQTYKGKVKWNFNMPWHDEAVILHEHGEIAIGEPHDYIPR